MAHDHIIYDSDPHFSIDVDTRAISYVSPDKLMLIQGDHNSEIFTFDMPKFADGHDMTKCDIKQVHFINLDGERGVLKSVGVYVIDDMKDDPEDTSKLVFSWTVPHTATRYVGSLSFAIKLACSGEDSTYEYVWSTLPYSSVPVSKTIENTDEFVGDYSDVLQDWYTTIVSAGEEGVTAINDARKQAVASVQDALANVGGIIVSITEPTTEKAVAWLNPETSILRIKDNNGDWKALDSIKGEPGGLNNVVQEFGSDETLVISQKAITEKINEIENTVNGNHTERIAVLESHVIDGNHGERIGILESNVIDGNVRERIGILENTVNDDHAGRLESLESKDAEIEETLSNHQTHIAALSDAMVNRTTRIRALETKDAELEATDTDLQTRVGTLEEKATELESTDTDLQTQITNVKTTADNNAKAIEAIDTSGCICQSGSYTGNGDKSVGDPIYFGTKFVPELVIVKDSGGVMSDLIALSNYHDTLYEGNAFLVKLLTVSETRVVRCEFGETSGGIQRLTISANGGTATNASHIYNASGVGYFWFAIGKKVES